MYVRMYAFYIFFRAESLGPEYSEMQILDLEVTWAESEPRTPFVCLLSIGSDPTTQIAALAKQKGIRKRAKISLTHSHELMHTLRGITNANVIKHF